MTRLKSEKRRIAETSQREQHQIHPSKKQRLDPKNGHSEHARKPSRSDGLPNLPTISDGLPNLPTISEHYARQVFTHPSLAPGETRQQELQSYDALEFVGDAYIQVISSRLIWSLYKDAGFTAGRMSQVREMLVKNETLSEYSIAYGFDKKLNVSSGAGPKHPNAKVKVNGDVFEAYVAAVVLSDPEGGFEAAEDWLTKLWEPKLKDLSVAPPDEQSKGELQKLIGAKGVFLHYFNEREPALDKKRGIETYFIGIRLTGWGYTNTKIGSGTGLSKKAAGMNAAKNVLQNKTLMDELVAKKAEAYAKKAAEEDVALKDEVA